MARARKSTVSTAARKRRAKKNVVKGTAHIHSTFNNTIVTITMTKTFFLGKFWYSGYKDQRNNTIYSTNGCWNNC